MRLFASTLALALMGFSIADAAESCSGEACASMTISVQSGCYQVSNTGQGEVRLRLGAHGFIVQGGTTQKLFGADGRCIATQQHGFIAEYAKPVSVVVPAPGRP